jgi:Phytanoyl-CoA dioxygenase (PhyH)
MSEVVYFEGPDTELLGPAPVADLVTDGLVRLDQRVPAELNAEVLDAVAGYEGDRFRCWDDLPVLHRVMQLPWISGAIRSFVGPDPVYDHSFVHLVPARYPHAQTWHADSVIDTRALAFDLQVFYYPQATTEEMGATLVLPGSHLRRAKNGALGVYRNIVGQRQLACDAGTVVLMHQGIWHCAQPNQTDTTRYMFKMRLRPGKDQRGLFATAGYDDPAVTERIYRGDHAFAGAELNIESIQRARLWRYLVGDDSVDVSYEGALTRMEI